MEQDAGNKAEQKALTLSDGCIVMGALLVALGIGLIYWPAGVIAAGLLLIALGFVVFD